MAAQEVNLESIKKDIDALKSDFKDVLKSLKELGSTKAEESKDKILDSLNADELKKYIDEIKLRGKGSVDSVNEAIKDDPIKSVAVAAGMGFLLAWILKK
ncbi:DUF883 family protein [Campylobacter suis]|uniref:DUF883 domain-containing protein n=1 Tax=Campylobacter suis TaxID=2790657 RepID=A0ABN7K8K6_9BACT|nr:DUF883 domain-containing protein [Campylobacter suis]CAD7287245.1 hypothetical protein LMG8286_00883 [Campylobacter suis]